MAREQSLADQLVFFLRTRAEAAEKIDAMPREGDAWPTLQTMLDQQTAMLSDALVQAAMAANRLGRLAACCPKDEA